MLTCPLTPHLALTITPLPNQPVTPGSTTIPTSSLNPISTAPSYPDPAADSTAKPGDKTINQPVTSLDCPALFAILGKMPSTPPPLIAISAGIGRGHPQYLDSVLYHLSTPARCIVATGPFWTLARRAYQLGARGGILTSIYNRTRNRAPTTLETALSKFPLARRFQNYAGISLVDHPLLARGFAQSCRVAYLHGEIAAPACAAIPSAWRTFVPLDNTAHRLEALGVPQDRIVVTGLVIEPQLLPIARGAFNSRCHRIRTDQPLTIAFFTSGAYPAPHIRTILIAIRALLSAGHKAVVFPGTDSKRAKQLTARLPQGVTTVTATTRAEETEKTAGLFPQLDIIVAPAHERTNWAVGLGLPLFALLPHIGPFAPLNYQFACQQGVCLPLTDPANFGATINRLRREGKLLRMALAGWEKHPITGAKTIADYIARFC